jgi:predicted metal-dependent phosphotriesterase family hydrolase
MKTQDPRFHGVSRRKAIRWIGAGAGLSALGASVGHEMARSHVPEAEKVKRLMMLLDAGIEDQILLTSDMGNTAHYKANWGLGYSSVLVQFVPKLRLAGVKETTIRKVLVDNPRRFLAFVPKAS